VAVDGVELNPVAEGNTVNHWMTCITVDADRACFPAEDLRRHLEADDIEARPLWKPMHLQPVFAGAPRRTDSTSEALFATGLCLPSGSGMTAAELARVVARIGEVVDGATRWAGPAAPPPGAVNEGRHHRGGAGFIGANTVRMLTTLPSAGVGTTPEVVALDDLSSGRRENLDGLDVTLIEGSILDDCALDEAFAGAEAVIHLAARPSVPRSIANPWTAHEVNATGTVKVLEAVRRHDVAQVIVASSSSVYGANQSNVFGTLNVLDAAGAVEVTNFVNISTDKAADPTSVLGYSKRVAEGLTAGAAVRYVGTYLSVRFGNVLGSRGSVLTAFHAQVAAGGPITVTDPEVTRYFMTAGEAVQLVVQAGAVGRAGEALVLDMGEPVRIDDVARQMAAQAPRPIEIAYTGLRPGEKLHEVLLAEGETDERPAHPLISHVAVPALVPADLEPLAAVAGRDAEVVEVLHDMTARMGSAPSPYEPQS